MVCVPTSSTAIKVERITESYGVVKSRTIEHCVGEEVLLLGSTHAGEIVGHTSPCFVRVDDVFAAAYTHSIHATVLLAKR